jgi:Zn-dependent peptidase ImmA (M78 family)/transcriptional regulator with XRE-family HTH domain
MPKTPRRNRQSEGSRTPRIVALVHPALLRWGRETAGMDLDDAAKKIGVKRDRVSEWESGAGRPSIPQLRNVAKAYRRPLAVFFMSAPPVEPAPPHDFRRLPGLDAPTTSPALAFAMRRARRRRSVAIELLDESGIQPTPFTIRASRSDNPEAVGESIRDWLGVRLEEQARWRTDHEALNGWIAALEARDVLVFQVNDVPLDEMRGFSISEPRLPVITLNATDHPRARAFTLMHELAHLVINVAGLCDPQRVRSRSGIINVQDEDVEIFCNHVAGASLVPARDLLHYPLVADVGDALREWSDTSIQNLATHFAVSREVILRRLLLLNRTTEEFYERKRAEYLAQYRRLAQQRRETDAGGFAPHYLIVLRNNGRRYTQVVLDAYSSDRIAPGDVADYLGVRLEHLDDISGAVRRRRVEG